MTRARQLGMSGVFALLALQLAWHGWILPIASHPMLVTLLYSLPLLPSVVLFVGRRPNAQYWAGVASLLYFCHGVAETWTTANARGLAIAEIGLALWIIVVGNWDALRARRNKSRSDPPAV